ncbi:TIGR03915 family putative DNA repair protein [Gorillibacterium sp. sgz5001074]|uniref:TIGR03915 family putative DNA repair protein n=1 Tax=Gorillibacterium sp. sgz5001074 TaxID=3446695 RepID=UPI003F67777A
MLDRPTLIYSYDGSFEGLMCCVFESYERKEIPMDICSENGEEGWLFESKRIVTDPVKADRVYRSIPGRISPEAQELVRLGFHTCSPRKEMLILQFLRLGYSRGRAVMDMLADDTVHDLNKAVQHLTREGHRFMGFVRFSVYGEVKVAVIRPDNAVLPVIMEHFCDRYRNEAFLIYDETHRMALVHRPGESRILPLEELSLAAPDAAEEQFRLLWKRFYDTVAVEGRVNPRLRMAHMPKKYWGQLPEMNGEGEARYMPKPDRLPHMAGETPSRLTIPSGGDS